MHKLPGKILHLFLIIFFSLLTSHFSLISPVYAVNPQQVYYPSLDSLNKDENDCWDDAAKTGKACTNLLEQKRAEVPILLKIGSNTIGCTNPKRCNLQQTALGNIAMVIGTMYAIPPASGLAYTKDLLANAGIFAKPAYAQGIGFAGLSPILPLWKTSRNISYIVITIVMIAIGFMVIFRMKIDPKTVISVQAAIPKIVLTLILITLSYPIVGFMIDLMYLVMALVVSVMLQGMGHPEKIAQTQTYFMTSDWLQLMGHVFGAGFSTLEDFLRANLPLYLGESVVNTILLSMFAGLPPFNALIFGVAALGVLFTFILFLGLLFTYIRILLLLLNSYIQLLIALILGPIQLLAEAIPGKSAFTEWILNVMANLVVFPATVAILLFGQFLTQINTDTQQLFSPPLIGVPSKGAFPAFLGLGVLFLAPNLIAQIKKMFHPKPILPVTAGTALAPLTGATQTAMGTASQFYYTKQIFDMFKPGGERHR